DANRVRNLCTLSIIELRMTRINLHARRGDDAIDQVIGLHAEALASAHLDERAVLIFLAEHIAELLRGARCEPYERVVEVRVLRSLLLVSERPQRLLHLRLRVILARVDDVVD